MKAEELMIGDWVNVLGEIGKVESLNAMPNTIEVGKVGYRAEFVKPIRLTEEILQKNGFSSEGYNMGVKGLHYAECQEAWYWKDKCLCVGSGKCMHAKGDYWQYCKGYFKYVHEFQHMLRLCGIDKEVVL